MVCIDNTNSYIVICYRCQSCWRIIWKRITKTLLNWQCIVICCNSNCWSRKESTRGFLLPFSTFMPFIWYVYSKCYHKPFTTFFSKDREKVSCFSHNGALSNGDLTWVYTIFVNKQVYSLYFLLSDIEKCYSYKSSS